MIYMGDTVNSHVKTSDARHKYSRGYLRIRNECSLCQNASPDNKMVRWIDYVDEDGITWESDEFPPSVEWQCKDHPNEHQHRVFEFIRMETINADDIKSTVYLWIGLDKQREWFCLCGHPWTKHRFHDERDISRDQYRCRLEKCKCKNYTKLCKECLTQGIYSKYGDN
jgi:hypothetical protein